MSRYRAVHCLIWNDDKFPFVSDDCKLVWFHLISTPISNDLGCFKASLEGLAAEMRWSLERYRVTFEEGLGEGFWKYDYKYQVVYFPNYFRYNKPANPNVLMRRLKSWDEIPTCELKHECLQQVKTFAEGWGEPFAKVTANLSERLGPTFPEQKQKQKQKHKQKISPPLSPSRGNANDVRISFDRFWKPYPRKEARERAWRVFQKLKPEDKQVDQMIEWITVAVRSDQWQQKQYIPHPATFLNGKLWESDPPPPKVDRPRLIDRRTESDLHLGETRISTEPEEDFDEETARREIDSELAEMEMALKAKSDSDLTKDERRWLAARAKRENS